MSDEQLTLRTDDGDCRVFVVTPERTGRHPAAILYSDAFGIRPAVLAMGRRLAEHGYVVLVPDLFYRVGPYEPIDPTAALAAGDFASALGKLRGGTDNRLAARDSRALLDHLLGRDDVAGDAVGVTGYCMGGAIALTVAGTYPDEVAAVGAFHAGNLVTDTDLSPHLIAPRIKGRVYIGGADNDKSFPPEAAERFGAVLTDAGVDHRLEIYPGAPHGYAMTDFPVYDVAAAERHWRELFTLFDDTLRHGRKAAGPVDQR